MKPTDIQPNGFLDNLAATEWIAVNLAGHVVARSATEEGLRIPEGGTAFSGAQLAEAGVIVLPKAKGTFDHDGDGKPGGSRPKPPKAETGAAATDADPANLNVTSSAPGEVAEPEPVVEEPPAVKSSGHKDDPGNTSRKASAGAHAKTPVKK